MSSGIQATPCSSVLQTSSRSTKRQFILTLALFAGFGGLNPVLLGSASNDSSVAQVFWLFVAVASVLGARRHFHSAGYVLGAVGIFAVGFGLLAIASSYWSIYPAATFRQSVALCLSILTGFSLGAANPTLDFLKALVSSCFLVCVLSLGGLVGGFGSSRGADNSFIGILTHRNSLASVAGVGLICSSIYRNQRTIKTVTLYLVFMTVVVLTTSRTTEISMVLSVLIVWGITVASSQRSGGVGVVIIAAGIVAGLAFFGGGPGLLLRLVGRDSTLTGRTDLWTLVVSFIKIKPWTGWGFGVAWQDDSPILAVTRLLFPELRSAHNSVLEVWLALGLFGVFLSVSWFMRSYWSVYRFYLMKRSLFARTCLTLLTFLALRFVTEAGFPTQNSSYLFIVVGIPLVIAPAVDGRHHGDGSS